MTRRHFLETSLASAILSLALPAIANGRTPRILLRSSWQIVNIGDIAHTPGVLALLENYIPEAEVRLWASLDLSDEVAAMQRWRFPKLTIVKGRLTDLETANSQLTEAVDWCDFLLHGSGPSLVAAPDAAAFIKRTGKPFGVYGITLDSFLSGRDRELLSQARFVFFRDSVSLERAKSEGVGCSRMEFGPDGAFACDLRNESAAERFLSQHNLQPGKFVCTIPRLRYTPYWKIRRTLLTDEQQRRAARNAAMADHDHAPLRDAILAITRETDLKVLICPEDQSQMQVGKEWLLDKLPPEVQARTVWREDFWLPDEAISTYVRSAGLFGLEMHSPILCLGNGVPAIVARFAEQTSKGNMWRDIGLGDWLFDFDDEEEIKNFVPAVLTMVQNPTRARKSVSAAQAFIRRHQQETMSVLKQNLQR